MSVEAPDIDGRNDAEGACTYCGCLTLNRSKPNGFQPDVFQCTTCAALLELQGPHALHRWPRSDMAVTLTLSHQAQDHVRRLLATGLYGDSSQRVVETLFLERLREVVRA